jgi:sec-independent protein translocase protein TatA
VDLSGSELIIILLVVVVLFGSARLPKLARSLGEAQREFRRGLLHHDDPAAAAMTEAESPARQATTKPAATPAATPASPT